MSKRATGDAPVAGLGARGYARAAEMRWRRLLAGIVLLGGGVGVALCASGGSRPPRPDEPGGAAAVAGAGPAPASAAAPGAPQPLGRLPVVDVHVHLSPDGVGNLQKLMRRWGFDHVVNLSGGHPLRGLKEQVAAAGKLPGRVTVFVSLGYEQAEAPGYGERMARLLEIAQRQGARGLKIAKLLGLGLPGPDGKLLPVDDPGLDPVFEKAGELGMPVAIHSGDPKAFWEPVTPKNERYAELSAHPGWSQYGRPVPSFDQILDQLERRVARHPRTTFLSVHFGNCAEDPERVARALRRHPNLYIDTAARIPEMGRHPPEKMRAFFVEFQDRILYGSDLGVGPEEEPLFLGSSGAEPPTEREQELFFTATRRYFETEDRAFEHPTPIQGSWKIDGIGLPREVLAKVYAGNAVRLLGLSLPSTAP
jgi:predicted TIM-barrel fold metal-dependent hydrolase